MNRALFFCLVGLMAPLFHLSGQQPVSIDEQRITALLNKIEIEDRYIGELIENNLTNLPVGIKKTVSGTTIIIAVDSARITPQGMIIDAYTQLVLPSTNKIITFALRGAVITPSGLSQMGPTRLEVISDFRIPFNDQLTLFLPANGHNFIDWDCQGFRSVNLNGMFEFSSEFFIPDDPSKNDKVTAGVEINTSDLNNILVSTSVTPFRIRGLGDISFTVLNAVVDMSDLVNCEGFAIPKDYQLAFPDAPQLWRGVFLKDLSIRLPSEFGGSKKRPEISAHDLLMDDFGVSGRFSGANILNVGQGNASGWPFSLSYLEIGLIQNRVAAGEIKGLIGIPFLGDEPLGYSAQIASTHDGLEYNFTVKAPSGTEFPVPFGGKVKLDKGCIFSLKAENGRFLPSAVLNGTMYLTGEPANIEGLRFERLRLIAESPYITGGKFETAGGAGFKLAGFGLSIDSISLAFRSGKAILGMNAKVGLMNKSEKGVSASTRLFINASVRKEPDTGNPENDRLKWAFDGILLEGLKVKGNVSLFSLEGSVFIVNDHPVYGDGFSGKVGFTAGKIIKDTAMVQISFGNKDDFRYWLAKIDIPTNLPLGAITLSKLGGGAYSNMERENLYAVNSDYLPKKDAGLGLLADAGFYVKTEKIFNADALFEIAFNKSGGVKFIRFTGEGRFFSEEEKESSLTRISAGVSMVYDNINDSFHANLNVFMNIANTIRGVGPGDLLGEAVIHCDPVDWYVYIGRPSCPLGVDVAGLLKTQTYFMAGTKIENMPLPPSEVASIISNIDMDFMKNERGVASGRGVAFGIMFKASAGIGRDKGFVYAYFNAGAGADIMLQDYGGASCEGRAGPIGINGWYASGQGYAYLMGRIGIRVKKSEFDIMDVAAALLVQAKMPNPSWFRGSIAARYRILGGLVKGKVNVTVVLGEECVLITNGNELGDLKLIGDVSPADGNREVDVFAAPQVSFNTTIDKEFGMMTLSDEYAMYRVKLDEFELRTADNKTIPGTLKWNPAHDMATLKLQDILPGKQQVTAKVKVHIEKKTASGWQTVTGDPETRSVAFNTGDEPKSIPENNVSYSYPLKNQYNFYKAEYPRGYIKLENGQPNLFNPVTGGTAWNFVARFKSGDRIFEVPFTYSSSDAMIWYDIPQNLSISDVYEMTILKKPALAGAIDGNLTRGDLLVTSGNQGDTIRMATTDITSTGTSEAETVLYSLSFRTSIYSTFSEKLRNINNWQYQLAIDDKSRNSSLMSLPYIRATLNESFDRYETEGIASGMGPLVYLEAQRGAGWIDNHVYPLVYDLYGTAGLTLDRNTNVLGLCPLRSLYISNIGTDSYLCDGNSSEARRSDFYIKYFVPLHVHSDYFELLNKAAAKYLNTAQAPPPQAQRLLYGNLSDISRGNYPFKISYRLPGINTVTTEKDFVFRY